jgi:hypothetical protein
MFLRSRYPIRYPDMSCSRWLPTAFTGRTRPDDLRRQPTSLTNLLDKQNAGRPLTDSERREAEGLVNLADLLSLLRLRAERVSGHAG